MTCINSVGGGDYDNGCDDVNNYYSNGNNIKRTVLSFK